MRLIGSRALYDAYAERVFDAHQCPSGPHLLRHPRPLEEVNLLRPLR